MLLKALIIYMSFFNGQKQNTGRAEKLFMVLIFR